MKLRSRTVHFYETVISSWTRTEGIPNASCANLKILLQRVRKSSIVGIKLEENNSLIIEVADWMFDQASGTFWMLVNRADANVSDVTFRNLQTRRTRKAMKERLEGIETSAHVVVRPNADGRSALVLLTMGSGISSVTIEKLFREAIKQVLKDPSNNALHHFPHPSGEKDPSGKPITYQVHYSVECFAHKGLQLEDALKGGAFQSMELIAHEHSNFDAGGNMQITQQSLLVTAGNAQTVTAPSLTNALRSFMKNKASHQYDKVKIRYRKQSGEDGSTTLKANDLDAAFTHREVLVFESDVEAQQLTISTTIIQPMLNLLP